VWSLLIPALLVLAAIPLVVALVRANELFCVVARGKAVRLVRGRVPQRLLDDMTDVLRAMPVTKAVVRVVVEEKRPRVYVDGDLSPEQKQRLRNTVSLWPIAKIRSAPRRRT
jgi:hypothetical protein